MPLKHNLTKKNYGKQLYIQITIQIRTQPLQWRDLDNLAYFCIEFIVTARSYAERGIAKAKLSVRPSVCLFVTLRYRDHIGWNFAIIISLLISLTISLSTDPNMADLLQREHLQIYFNLQILSGIGVG